MVQRMSLWFLSFNTSTRERERELCQNAELLDLKALMRCSNHIFLKAFAAAFEFATKRVCVLGAFPAGARLLHRVSKATHATRVAG